VAAYFVFKRGSGLDESRITRGGSRKRANLKKRRFLDESGQMRRDSPKRRTVKNNT
jgi:hypothetical protein